MFLVAVVFYVHNPVQATSTIRCVESVLLLGRYMFKYYLVAQAFVHSCFRGNRMPKCFRDDSHNAFLWMDGIFKPFRMNRKFCRVAVFFLLTVCTSVPRVSAREIASPVPTSSSTSSDTAPAADIPKEVVKNQIDRTFTAAGDVTGDGNEAHLTIHVTGRSMTSAFTWSLTITGRGGAVLFKVERNDAWLDGFFAQDGYEADCSGYLACKKHYYFEDLPKTIFDSLKPTDSSESKNDRVTSNLRETATAFFTKHDVPPASREAALAEMRHTLTKPGFHVLDVPYSPVEWDPSRVWVKSIQMFVPYQ